MSAHAPPLSGWARRKVEALARDSGSDAIALIDGAGLLVERAALSGFSVPGRVSAGGGCRLYAAKDDHVALALPRADDRALLPALFGDAGFSQTEDAAITRRIADESAGGFVAQGRALGLAVARLGETPHAPAILVAARGPAAAPAQRKRRVVDLSALWAGPLAARFLAALGFDVVKVENRRRPDGMRSGAPGFFEALNGAKTQVALDFDDPADLEALRALIADADIVVESSRPRALRHLGVDADKIVRTWPVVWISLTAHGVDEQGGAAIGFGDDCSVAGGLSRMLFDATGKIAFAGDAAADPISGIAAADAAWRLWKRGEGARVILSMAAVVAGAIAAAHREDPAGFTQELTGWADAEGSEIAPQSPVRPRERVARAC